MAGEVFDKSVYSCTGTFLNGINNCRKDCQGTRRHKRRSAQLEVYPIINEPFFRDMMRANRNFSSKETQTKVALSLRTLLLVIFMPLGWKFFNFFP